MKVVTTYVLPEAVVTKSGLMYVGAKKKQNKKNIAPTYVLNRAQVLIAACFQKAVHDSVLRLNPPPNLAAPVPKLPAIARVLNFVQPVA